MQKTTAGDELPVAKLEGAFLDALRRGPVVLTSPTGSGKSTLVPQWCGAQGFTLVIQPRRVACRSLAVRVAQLMGSPLGGEVGYAVRGERRSGPDTRILFATPGVVLQRIARGDLGGVHTLIIDEFHERRLDVDLILALMVAQADAPRLVVMSATLDGERVAAHVSGVCLESEGRLFPVDVRYLPDRLARPDPKAVEGRVLRALDQHEATGDVLVFLPGKGEINGLAKALSGRRDLAVLPLHGGLTLEAQSAVFAATDRRKVILSTNVAETSLTVPGIRMVIDAGLVRRTRYHQGRGVLALADVAEDSADQRAGRAGRMAAGVAVRLWGEGHRLEPVTPPEMHRESLVPLVLAAAACRQDGEAPLAGLAFLDPPKDHAVEAAVADLQALGALDDAGAITARGRQMFGLPLDPALARLIVEGEARDQLEDVIDLVSALDLSRPLFQQSRPEHLEDDLQAGGCDAVACIRAVRAADPRHDNPHRLSPQGWRDARQQGDRLRSAFGLGPRRGPDDEIDRRALALVALAANPQVAHVARDRGKRVGWSNGGTELELARESAALRRDPLPEAVAVFETRAIGFGARDTRILATCAMPLTVQWMAAAGLGRDRLGAMSVQRGAIVATVERIYAKKIIDSREEIPEGAIAREAAVALIRDNRALKGAAEIGGDRLASAALWAALVEAGVERGEATEVARWGGDLEAWLRHRIEALGLETGEDLALLSPEDVLPPALPSWVQEKLDRSFPRQITLDEVRYRAHYAPQRRRVTLEKLSGGRRRPLPPAEYLPAFGGFKVFVQEKSNVRQIR